MTVSVQEIQRRYELFNGDDTEAMLAEFAPNAVYTQLDSGQVAAGPDGIRAVMQGWKHFFTGARIADIQVKEAPELVDSAKVDGAVQCFVVDFVGHGVYDNTIPGLEDVAPAKGQKVSLPIGETVWLNVAGQFVQVDNTIQVSALQ